MTTPEVGRVTDRKDQTRAVDRDCVCGPGAMEARVYGGARGWGGTGTSSILEPKAAGPARNEPLPTRSVQVLGVGEMSDSPRAGETWRTAPPT